ncbi:MAG: hypothetical protein H0U07_04830 [Actinobacteria bacterium]|nr:hypothetical protein [Actinomycetota bacterium]
MAGVDEPRRPVLVRVGEQGLSLCADARPVLDGLAPGGHSLGDVLASLRRHVRRRLEAP